MKYSLRERLGYWLEGFAFLDRLTLRYDGEAPRGSRYINRINGHVVVRVFRAK